MEPEARAEAGAGAGQSVGHAFLWPVPPLPLLERSCSDCGGRSSAAAHREQVGHNYRPHHHPTIIPTIPGWEVPASVE